jgi:hypothetical protein
MTHMDVIWIILSKSVIIFFMINEIIYFYFFAFNFSSNVLVLLFNKF